MRSLISYLAGGLAAAALFIGTPVGAASQSSRDPAAGPVAAGSPSTTTPTTTSPPAVTARRRDAAPARATATRLTATAPSVAAVAEESGGGLNEVYCAACVGLGTFTLFSGGTSMLPYLLANTSTVGTVAGACLMACRSVIEQLMK